MHGPQLKKEILDLLCKIEDSAPEYCTVYQQQIDEYYKQLQLIAKVPMERLRAVISREFPVYYRNLKGRAKC